jgi:hypothetical protein
MGRSVPSVHEPEPVARWAGSSVGKLENTRAVPGFSPSPAFMNQNSSAMGGVVSGKLENTRAVTGFSPHRFLTGFSPSPVSRLERESFNFAMMK